MTVPCSNIPKGCFTFSAPSFITALLEEGGKSPFQAGQRGAARGIAGQGVAGWGRAGQGHGQRRAGPWGAQGRAMGSAGQGGAGWGRGGLRWTLGWVGSAGPLYGVSSSASTALAIRHPLLDRYITRWAGLGWAKTLATARSGSRLSSPARCGGDGVLPPHPPPHPTLTRSQPRGPFPRSTIPPARGRSSPGPS